MRARRRLLLALSIAATTIGCVDMIAPKAPANGDAGAIFDEVWREYDRHYAFFASRGVDWATVRERYRPAALTGGPALERAICRMLDTLHDYHVVLFSDYGACGSPPLRRTYPYDPVAAARYLGASYMATKSGLTTYGQIGVASYIRIARFAGPEQAAEIDSVLAAFPYMFGLVLDLRGNLGGNSRTAEAIAGRFTDSTRAYLTVRTRSGPAHDDFSAPVTWWVHPMGSKRFTGPIVLIVDRSVGSAGEDFTMAMRALPNVTLLGDTTSGNASNPLWRELPNGWSFWVPQSIETTIDGLTPTVDGGIPPAIVVRSTTADSLNGIDRLIDSAVARLTP